MARRWLLFLCTVFALACGSSDEGSSGSTKPAGTLRFEPDPTPSGVAITLRAKELGQDRLVLEIVGHSLADLYGVAFRAKLDPAVLAFSKLEPSGAWTSTAPIALGSEKTPGLVVAALSEKGKAQGVSGTEVVLGVLTLSLKSAVPTTVELVSSRSALVGADGHPRTSVGWAGGKLVSD